MPFEFCFARFLKPFKKNELFGRFVSHLKTFNGSALSERVDDFKEAKFCPAGLKIA